MASFGSMPMTFQHTATRRWLPSWINTKRILTLFQHTATRRWLQAFIDALTRNLGFQHTAARRRLPDYYLATLNEVIVSTHSRAEAAA